MKMIVGQNTSTKEIRNLSCKLLWLWSSYRTQRNSITAQKMKFSIKDFFSKYDQTAVSCGFGYINRSNPKWKTSFFLRSEWRLLHQANNKWRNPSYQFNFFLADQTSKLWICIATLSLLKMSTHAYEKTCFNYSYLQ